MLCLCVFLSTTYGQETTEKQKTISFDKELIDFNASYYGNMVWNPGLKFGAEYLWKEKVNTNVKHKKKCDKPVSQLNFLKIEYPA